ncbi:hypothetical protein [Mycobacterium timonense]|uniref:Uncharacterized protein n=1 Tax=Mycobacterium timonense TaxID=701043 RepID=A0A7I9Z8D5_9MYCO|nr:hypothetical protein [Mycobacterium timonense]GFG97136.1 hypothetical protein MTIM_30150 [Mycobacterium timonense]
MNSPKTKKTIKAAAATAGFVMVLFAPTGCLVTTATTAGTGGGTTGGTLGGTIGGIVGGITGGLGL